MKPRRLVALLLPAALAIACASTPEVSGFDEVPPADELYAKGLEALEGLDFLGVYHYVDYEGAIEIFQSIVDNYPYSEYAVESEIRIADAYFDDTKYDEALSYYRDFADLHPQHEKVPYAIYRAALCHERQVREPYRDQTPTREAIVFLDRLLLSHPHSEYAKKAEPLWRDLQIRLAQHDEGIADFYRKRGEYEAASERYRSLLNDFPGLGLDDRVLYKLGECYTALRRLDEADRIYRTIVVHYADSHYAFEAKKRIASNLEFD